MINQNYTCAFCKISFIKAFPNEVFEEHKRLFTDALNQQMSAVCDDCHRKFMRWFQNLDQAAIKKLKDTW